MDLQTVRAGPRGDAVTGSQNAIRSGLHVLDTADLEAGQVSLAWSPADWRLAKGGLSECEIALLDCVPVVRDASWYARLWDLGVRRAAGLHVEAVVFVPGCQFEFGRNLCDATGAVVALIIPALDGIGEIEDLVALDLDSGALARWRGRAAVLGAEMILAPRLGDPLRVFPDARAWLGGNCEGVMILDWRKAAAALEGVTLEVDSVEFGQQLREHLTRPAPPIVVRVNRRVAA
jgi:hypothetical protein